VGWSYSLVQWVTIIILLLRAIKIDTKGIKPRIRTVRYTGAYIYINKANNKNNHVKSGDRDN